MPPISNTQVEIGKSYSPLDGFGRGSGVIAEAGANAHSPALPTVFGLNRNRPVASHEMIMSYPTNYD